MASGEHMRAARWLPLLAAVALCAAGCGRSRLASASQVLITHERAPMQIQLSLPKQRFIAGEAMKVTVTLTNSGAQAIEVPDPALNSNWQPTYTVKGPAYERGFTFSFRSAVFQDSSPNPVGAKPETVSLQPGQARSSLVPIERLIRLVEPGAYTLIATLEWEGWSVQSQPVAFTIERPGLRSCQLAATPGLQDSYNIPVFCLQQDPSGEGEVLVAMFQEHLQTEQIVLSNMEPFATPAAGAETIFSPWMNYSGLGTPSPRAGWQAGARLGVVDFRETEGAQLTLPWVPRIIRPALSPLSGVLDLFLLDEKGTGLSRVRFPAPGQGGEPTRTETVPLPARAVGGRAALSPQGTGDRRYALLIAESGEDVTLILVDAGSGAEAPGLRSVKVKGLRVLPDSEPALRIDGQGQAHGAVLLGGVPEASGAQAVSLVEVVWPAGESGEPSVKVEEVARLDAAPRATAVAYSLTRGAPRREWVLLTADATRLVSSLAPGERRMLRGSPLLPLELLVLKELACLLTLSDAGTPQFIHLF